MKEEIMSGTAINYYHHCGYPCHLAAGTVHPYRQADQPRLSRAFLVNTTALPNPGIIFLIPFIERLVRVNITENMIDAGLQEIITSDSLNAQVDAQVYFKVRSDEESVKASQYNVFNYMVQNCGAGENNVKKYHRHNDG